MRKQFIYAILAVLITNITGLIIINSSSKNSSNNLDANELVNTIKNDPNLSKQIIEIASKIETADTQNIKGDQGEKGDKGDKGDTGAQGAKGTTTNVSTVSSDTSVIPVNRGGTGASDITTALNNLLPSQVGNSGKFLGTNGSTASWLSSTSNFPKLNTLTAPRGTTTSVTSDQIKSGLLVEVAASDGTNEDRPFITFPSPIDDPSLIGYVTHIVAQQETGNLNRMGASFGYPISFPASLGDFTALSASSYDFSITPLTIIYEVNGVEKEVTLNEDYTSHPQDLLTDIFAESLLEETIDIAINYDVPGNFPNYTFALTTRQKGDGTSISIVDPGAGDPLDLASLNSNPGFVGYLGYDGTELGVGELNEDNMIGGGYTHTWPDDPYGLDQQTLSVVATSTGWRSLNTALRSEFVSFSPTTNYFLTNDHKNLGLILNVLDEEIFNIRSRLDALE